MRILLTGGTGFLGSHVAEQLIARGDIVRATTRRGSNRQLLQALGAEIAEVSLETGDGLRDAFDGVAAVIHCAGGGQVTSPDAFRTQNVLPTQTLLRVIVDNDIKLTRFVHASTIAAAPRAMPQPVHLGNTQDPPARSAYGIAKREAENVVLAASTKVPTTIVRLPALYGERDTRWLTPFKAAQRGISPILGRGNAMSVLYATDAASAMIAPLDRAHESGRIYSAEDGTPITQRELGRAMGAALGKRPVQIPVPAFVLYTAAQLAEWSSKLTKKKVFLTRDKVDDLLFDGWTCDSTTLRQELGWQSLVDLAEGTRRTAAWYRAENFLP